MAANYILLERIELNDTAASVTFSNIPQTGYTDLKIVASIKTNRSGTFQANMLLNFNGVTTNLSSRVLRGLNTSVDSYSAASAIEFSADASGSTATNTFGNAEIYIPNYTSSNSKSVSIDSVAEANETNQFSYLTAGLWSNSAAITSITISSKDAGTSLLQYSTFSLYGIAAVGTTPLVAPKADGGNVIATDGTYWYHAFLSNGTFTPQVGLSADVLVVAGGGAGAGSFGGGAGAGGYLEFASQSLSVGNYTCTVGAGAAGNTSTRGSNGNDSQFGALTLVKGGGGGGVYGINGGASIGADGGSGGGAGSASIANAGGNPTSGQGYAGGSVSSGVGSPYYTNAGGGGAGAVGASITSGSQAGGAGGIGKFSTLTDAAGAATGLGVLSGGHYYFAGGGGAGSFGGGGAGAGGTGGGGTGTSSTGGSGLANTGGGGAGAGGNSGASSGAGGSGIIIIRYAV